MTNPLIFFGIVERSKWNLPLARKVSSPRVSPNSRVVIFKHARVFRFLYYPWVNEPLLVVYVREDPNNKCMHAHH